LGFCRRESHYRLSLVLYLFLKKLKTRELDLKLMKENIAANIQIFGLLKTIDSHKRYDF
jgi:hypothetical protein